MQLKNAPSEGLLSCKINFTSEGAYYYVCIKADQATDWQVKSELNKPCGTIDFPSQKNIDFYIFARNAKFDTPSLDIKNEHIQNKNYESFSEAIEEYIKNNYDNDCSSGCYIPIKFISGIDQTLTIKNIKLVYNEGTKISTSLYDAIKKIPTINMGFKKLDLKYSNITVTETSGDFSLYLNGNLIGSKKIKIIKMAEITDIFPKTVAAGVLTTFTIKLSNKSDITSYEWDFGDNAEKTTSSNQAEHTYTEIKDYELEVTIIDKNGNKNSKTFTISVVSPEQIIPVEIENKRENLINLKNKTGHLPNWIRDYVNKMIDLEELNNSLNKIEEDFNDASDEDEYIRIMLDLNSLNIPQTITKSEFGSNIFVPEEQRIDLDNLRKAGAGTYNSSLEEGYKKAIIGWILENANANYNYSVYSFIYPEKIEPILTLFSLKLNPTNTTYLVLEGEPVFKGDYETYDDFYYLSIDSKKTIEFLYPGKVLLEEPLEEEEKLILKNYQLLTIKPRLYLLNGKEKEVSSEVLNVFKKNNWPFLIIDLLEEFEAVGLTKEERITLGLPARDELDLLIKEAYKLLNLITFFTILKPNEVRAWTLKKGEKVLEAAEKIHSDFKKNFICAEIINWKDLIETGGLQNAKEKGVIRTEGKEYIVQDGDVVIIKHSA